jgi:hypothetical protein
VCSNLNYLHYRGESFTGTNGRVEYALVRLATAKYY